jgi:hypothetical protein
MSTFSTQGDSKPQKDAFTLADYGNPTPHWLHTHSCLCIIRRCWLAAQEADAPKQQQCRKGYDPFIGDNNGYGFLNSAD